MIKTQKLWKSKLKLESVPTKLTVSWKSVGESKRVLEKQLNVTVTTPQTRVFEKPKFHKLTSKHCFYNFESN